MDGGDNAVSTELVFGLVGAVGTDLGLVADQLRIALDEFSYEATEVRLSGLLHALDWDLDLPEKPIDVHIATHMDAGDQLRRRWRRGDALSLLSLTQIMDTRAQENENDDASQPLERHAFILRSLKHPEEVELLRSIYGSRFYLVSAYAPRSHREAALTSQFAREYGSEDPSEWTYSPRDLMERDESGAEPPDLEAEEQNKGQNVRDTFHRADFFLDAREEGPLKNEMKRMLEIVFGHPFRTPKLDEYALFAAEGASRRSAEPGRQVGAAVIGTDGTVIALGANEVPKAGGGTYSEETEAAKDGREFRKDVDTNDSKQHEIAREILAELDEWLEDGAESADILAAIERTRLGDLIEFGRAVHAEMDALLDAARRGVSVQGGMLYTTTFPCHNCARHIVGAGISRVVYVAPYAKSLAKVLHEDSIEVASEEPSDEAVHFEPFVGVAPRRYLEFFKAGKRKDSVGRIVSFVPSEAVPRINDVEPDDLRPRQERYSQREEQALDLLGEIFEGTELGLASGGD